MPTDSGFQISHPIDVRNSRAQLFDRSARLISGGTPTGLIWPKPDIVRSGWRYPALSTVAKHDLSRLPVHHEMAVLVGGRQPILDFVPPHPNLLDPTLGVGNRCHGIVTLRFTDPRQFLGARHVRFLNLQAQVA